MRYSWWILVMLLLVVQAESAAPGSIETEGLLLPLRCTVGETCWVANYVDVDPTGGGKDFHCKPRTYDGHDGVDVAIRDVGVMKEGVPVVASASGLVRNVREEEMGTFIIFR